ncbi:MAG: glycosyl transferase [Chloroflexi bacterium]|nr:glycosyl transferase [Chloroflexota bacterium]
MQYGYFDDVNREYVITNPRTPVKWINYVGTLAFGGFVDHTGGSLICKSDPSLNRIVKYIPQLPGSEFKGETLYIRFPQGMNYKVFSPFFVPTLDRYDRFECHVGLGYSRFVSEFYGIRTEVIVFVPTGADCVIRDIRITNLTGSPLELDVIPVVEYTHFDALKQFTNADWVPQTMQSKAQRIEGDRLVLSQYAFMLRDLRVNYLTSNLPVASFESDRKRFLGDNEYGTWVSPHSLQAPELSCTEAQRGDNIGALLHHLGVVQPGETKRLITQLGQAPSVEQALPSIYQWWDEQAVDAAFEQLLTFWRDYLAVMQVETPNASMNSMLNIHHPHQCHTTKNWSRYLSLYQLGIGSRGIGVRDSSQDVMGVVAHIPDESRQFITQLISVQRRNGSAYHQFYPLTMEATVGDSAEMEDRPKYYSDDHLWIILAVSAYLKETGDLAFLEQLVPYYDKDKAGQPLESDTVYGHMQRALEFTRGDVGQHGLPLLGFADWNDTMNLPTGAESIFTACLYGKALLDMITLAEFRQDAVAVEKYTAYHAEMKARVNQHAWDGEWYVEYFDAQGNPLGSRHNPTGQIYTYGQAWAVMAGFADPDRAYTALESVNKRLNTRNGIKLSAPGFNGFDPKIGGMSTYPPGAKENGGIFLHINPWVMIAETLLGNGSRAFRYYDQINPAAKNDRIDEYECEPYVYAQNILADEHPLFGLARNSWLSGTATWTYQAATQYILGIQPTYQGLRINPCIPPEWDGFSVTRQYREATYVITVSNPDHQSQGVRAVRVDGQEISGDVLPIFADGNTHQVEVML